MYNLYEEEEDAHVGEDDQPDVGLGCLDLLAWHQPGADGNLENIIKYIRHLAD